MKAHSKNKFGDIVFELNRRKSRKLLALAKAGSIPKLTKKWREEKIDELQDLVEQSHLSGLKRWVRKNAEFEEVRFRGRSAKDNKAYEVRDRVLKRRGRRHHIIYVPFRRTTCLKVGKSNHGLGRVASQIDAYYFRDATRVRVYFLKHSRKRFLPALECALTHLYRPFHLYKWPESKSYLRQCPTCKDMKFVRKAVKKLFSV